MIGLLNPKPIAGVVEHPATGTVALRLRWDGYRVPPRVARAQALRIAAEVEEQTLRSSQDWQVRVPDKVVPVDKVWIGCCVCIDLASDSQAQAARSILEELAKEVSLRQ